MVALTSAAAAVTWVVVLTSDTCSSSTAYAPTPWATIEIAARATRCDRLPEFIPARPRPARLAPWERAGRVRLALAEGWLGSRKAARWRARALRPQPSS